MKFISHRGNITGREPRYENSPLYIEQAIKAGFDVEVDIWYMDNEYWLGHDRPEYRTGIHFLKKWYEYLWIHCKNIEALEHMFITRQTYRKGFRLNYFWHEEDTLTLTSKGIPWVYPNKGPIRGGIMVMPEYNDEEIPTYVGGICSDKIGLYRDEFTKNLGYTKEKIKI